MGSKVRTITACLVLFVLLVLSVLVEAGKDYYSILDVPRDAPKTQIKKHFKKLSRVYHPDKNPGDSSASEKFMEIAEAYEILSNDEKRQTYDRYGEEGVKQQQQQQQNGGHNPFGSMFSQFFGGGQHQAKPRTPNIEIPIHVTLEDLYNGVNVEVDVSKHVICNHCFGSGAHSPDSIRTCSTCNGQGSTLRQVQLAPGFVQQFQQTCEKCEGKGKTITQKCKVCDGHKIKRGNEQYTVSIEKGMSSGQKIVVEEESNESPGIDPGDIVFTINTSNHPIFERRGNNLYTRININLIEALTGFSKTINHLDQTPITFKRSDVTQYGLVDTITGAGMPLVDNHDQFGDLYVEYIVTFPSHVDLDFVKGNNITMLQTKNETNQQSIELKNQVSKPDHDEF